jgi:hypothetical protein
MRLRRRRFRLRALWKSRELRPAVDRTAAIRPGAILLLSTVRNEKVRLPYFLDYYRRLGVDHFLFVDNSSEDGTDRFLAEQDDVSLWTTPASYKAARHGADWVNGLLRRHGHGHWCLTLDPDEFLVYPFCDSRPLQALTDWLDDAGLRSFPAMLVDMYPRGRIDREPYRPGQDPFEIAGWFDAGNYTFRRNPTYNELWIQGGPRARVFFADAPERAPALNKIPLVRWHRAYAYVNSTHMLLPRGLNRVYEQNGGEKASGCLLHAKFIDTFPAKAAEELVRRQHYAQSHEYRAYAEALRDNPDFWCKWSEKYVNWRQLEILGLMSKGNWA